MKKVSFIVPVYNAQDVIERCVKSICAQTYKDIEVILIDDGSKDSSGKLCCQLAEEDHRIRVISKENGGVSSARNRGIHEALGEYIQFVDSDDYLECHYTEHMVHAMETEQSDLVIGGYTIENGCSKKREEKKELCWNNGEKLEYFGALYQNYYIHPVWNKLFIRSKIQNEFDVQSSMGEDCRFVLQYMEKCEDVSVIREAGYYYQVDSGMSLTNTARKDGYLNAAKICVQGLHYINCSGGGASDYGPIYTLFLTDVDKCFYEILESSITNMQKKKMLKEISNDPLFQHAIQDKSILKKNQRIRFILLRWKLYGLLIGIMKIRNRKGEK